MIQKILQYRFSLSIMLAGLPSFPAAWFRTREYRLLLPAILTAGFSGTVLCILLTANSPSKTNEIRRRYNDLTQQALQKKDSAAAELYFARLLTLSDDPNQTSFDHAVSLYNTSNAVADTNVMLLSGDTGKDCTAPDVFAHRAILLLQSLAPRHHNVSGFQPAHRFLADHWKSRRPVTDVTSLFALQHNVYGHPKQKQPAVRLAKFLADHNHHEPAIRTLKRWAPGNPDVCMALALSYNRLGNSQQAQRRLKQSEQLLRNAVGRNPNGTTERLDLSRVLGAQGRVLESLFVLAEGYRQLDEPVLADHLIQRYTTWLSLMSPRDARRQLNDIQLALAPAERALADNVAYDTDELQLSTGEKVSLPDPIVRFHKALLTGEGQWLAPLLLGTDQAAQNNFTEAIVLLKKAASIVPFHPVVANNLAWSLLQEHIAAVASEQSNDRHATKTESKTLARAWQYAETAVGACPQNVTFRETRGLIAAFTNRWPTAVSDLQFCKAAGVQSVLLHQSLTRAQHKLKK